MMVALTRHAEEQFIKRSRWPDATRNDIEEAWHGGVRKYVPGKSGLTKFHEPSGTILVGKWNEEDQEWVIATVLRAEYESMRDPEESCYCTRCRISYTPESNAGNCPKCGS